MTCALLCQPLDLTKGVKTGYDWGRSDGWNYSLFLIIVLIIFGAGKIPQLGEGLGKAIKGFKKSVAEADALDVTPNSEQPTAGQESQPAEQISAQETTIQPEAPPPQNGPAQQSETQQATRQG